jgi:hypothetical protein
MASVSSFALPTNLLDFIPSVLRSRIDVFCSTRLNFFRLLRAMILFAVPVPISNEELTRLRDLPVEDSRARARKVFQDHKPNQRKPAADQKNS